MHPPSRTTNGAPSKPGNPLKRPRTVSSSRALSPDRHASTFSLNVIICHPKFDRYNHWALQLHDTDTVDDDTIIEVRGIFPLFKFVTYKCRPGLYSLGILQAVRLQEFTLNMDGFYSLQRAIQHEVPVKNDSAKWTSQDYVLEVLKMLEEEWWLDEDDKDYMRAKRRLISMYGPIERAQLTARPDELNMEYEMDVEDKHIKHENDKHHDNSDVKMESVRSEARVGGLD